MARTIKREIDLSARHRLILDQLQETGRIRVADFSRETGVSEVTIRKDLDKLAQEGLLVRTHGGAVAPHQLSGGHNYGERRSVKKQEKLRIARAVSELINDGDCIIINVGTTCEYVVNEIKSKHDLFVITNALPILNQLNGCANIKTFFLGGRFEPEMQITTGDNVIEQLSRYSANKLIMGMDGVDPSLGLMSRNHLEDYIMHKMIEQSQEKILVIDDSKLGCSSFFRIADIDVFDTIVTNACPEKEDILQQIESKGLRVIRA